MCNMFKVNNENTRTTSKATIKTGIIFIVGTIGTTPPFKNSLHPFEAPPPLFPSPLWKPQVSHPSSPPVKTLPLNLKYFPVSATHCDSSSRRAAIFKKEF